MKIISLLQQKVNQIISGAGLGHGVLSESSFLETFRSGSKYVFGLRLGAGVCLDTCLEFLDAVKVNGMSLSFDGNGDTIWVGVSESSERPYRVYCLVANWANTHGVDVLSGDGYSFGFQRKAGEKGNVSSSVHDMAYLGISDAKVDTSRLVSDVLGYIGMLGVRGLVRNEGGIKALVGAVVWRLYLSWYKRDRYRRRISGVLRSVGMSKQADNFDKCGQHVYNLECCQCGYVHEVTFHCKLRVCPECGWARKVEFTKAYADALRSLGRLRFMTLTLKNVANLKDGVSRIRRCFSKLRHRKGYKHRIKGGLYGIESPVGANGLWHVHLHCIYGGAWIEQAELADDWEKITGDSRVVDIRAVKHGRSPVGYILKYVNKHDSIVQAGDDKVGEYVSVLYKTRLLQPFGSLLGAKAEKGVFVCPECGGSVWRVVDVESGRTVFDELEYLRSRASPFVTW